MLYPFSEYDFKRRRFFRTNIMKLQSCLMIRCIAVNSINMKELFFKLKDYIEKQFPNAIITLMSNKSYWKYPECNDIVYNLSNNKFIKISDFIKQFFLSWVYDVSHVYSLDLNRSIYAEDAIWSQNCHPE